MERTVQVMQVGSANPMVGLEGRASLLRNLSHALKSNATFFGAEGRPGNMIGPSMCPPLRFLTRTSISSYLSDFQNMAQTS
jgi:Protein of unknown function (DUF1688)